MDKKRLINVNIESHARVPAPHELQRLLPAPEASLRAVHEGRAAIRSILDDEDRRLLLIVGPCSIHDTKAALEYAHRLKPLADRVRERCLIAMRVYFEKPRTTVGWKGLINDPFLNDSFHIEEGLRKARKLLIDITRLGLATATEVLDPIAPQYLSELVCWYAVGARTIESQTHREIASGLSAPVGFKNGTDGDFQVAIDAMRSALRPHHFLGIDARGRTCVFRTRGNPYGHIVLRGGGGRPNCGARSVALCAQALEKAGLPRRILVDCSHGNSGKDHTRQAAVFSSCLRRSRRLLSPLMGMMLESSLHEGKQALPEGLKDISALRYGVSVTDACIGWEETRKLILAV